MTDDYADLRNDAREVYELILSALNIDEKINNLRLKYIDENDPQIKDKSAYLEEMRGIWVIARTWTGTNQVKRLQGFLTSFASSLSKSEAASPGEKKAVQDFLDYINELIKKT